MFVWRVMKCHFTSLASTSTTAAPSPFLFMLYIVTTLTLSWQNSAWWEEITFKCGGGGGAWRAKKGKQNDIHGCCRYVKKSVIINAKYKNRKNIAWEVERKFKSKQFVGVFHIPSELRWRIVPKETMLKGDKTIGLSRHSMMNKFVERDWNGSIFRCYRTRMNSRSFFCYS